MEFEWCLNWNFELLPASEIWQISMIQKLQINFKAQEYDAVC